MIRLFKRLFKRFKPTYNLVYCKRNGKTRMYHIKKPSLRYQFDNIKEGETNVGFRAWCYNRRGVRSFRYDGIISLTKN